jgi:polygalacturonase
VSEQAGEEWVVTPLDADRIDPRALAEVVVEFDEGEEVITPKTGNRFGSYDLNEAARYIFFFSNRIQKGGMG